MPATRGAEVGSSYFFGGGLIKIRGREISFTDRERTASQPDSYPDITAAKYWWSIALGACGFAALSYMGLPGRELTWALIFAVVVAALLGILDGGSGFQIARGQRVQFAIASVASLFMFALPLLAYLAGFLAAKRWPNRFRTRYMRRKLERDPDGDASQEISDDH